MSKIEWTNETWNPVTGCSKYSEGCQNCYAERMTKRLAAMGQEKYKNGFNKVVFHPEAISKHNFSRLDKKRKMIFVNSMSDTFHRDVTDAEIKIILNECEWNDPNVFQILTKRAERLPRFEYPHNVWLGVTVEMAKYKNRVDYLKQTNAKIKFLSCEPLLGDLGELDLTGIDWVIVGGESGPGARPMHPDWVRNIQKQCQEQNVPFFFKQWGEWSVVYERNKGGTTDNYFNDTETEYYNKYRRLNFAGGCGFHGENVCYFDKVGKSKSGAILDGKEYKEFPKFLQKEGQ